MYRVDVDRIGIRSVVAALACMLPGLLLLACEPDLDSLTALAGGGADSGSSPGLGGSASSGGSANTSCSNSSRDDDESDIDCGGESECSRCGLDKVCQLDVDCATNYCRESRCSLATCTDNVRNQDETGLDCGGVCAQDGKRCGLDQACESHGDCSTSYCNDGICASHCISGIKDGDETDRDCGGAECDPCADGLRCESDQECKSGVCLNGTCSPQACDDGRRDQDETDVDCGGVCRVVPLRCAVGEKCQVASDCETFLCTNQLCVADQVTPTNYIIDDLEDQDNKIANTEGRAGYWYRYGDTSAGSNQTAGVLAIPGTRGITSSFAFNTYGEGYTSWGAGIGLDLNNPSGSTKAAYNASAYTGITFWARSDVLISVKVLFPDVYSDQSIGICRTCNHHFHTTANLEPEWKKFTILFSSLNPEGGVGDPPRDFLDTAQLIGVQFRTPTGATFDYWIDDVAFYKQ